MTEAGGGWGRSIKVWREAAHMAASLTLLQITLPGRAGISNAFSAAYGSRTAPVDLDQCRHSGIGCIGRWFI